MYLPLMHSVELVNRYKRVLSLVVKHVKGSLRKRMILRALALYTHMYSIGESPLQIKS